MIPIQVKINLSKNNLNQCFLIFMELKKQRKARLWRKLLLKNRSKRLWRSKKCRQTWWSPGKMRNSPIIGYTLVEGSLAWRGGQARKRPVLKPGKQQFKFLFLKLVFWEVALIPLLLWAPYCRRNLLYVFGAKKYKKKSVFSEHQSHYKLICLKHSKTRMKAERVCQEEKVSSWAHVSILYYK